jgi:hypothetical protein
LERVGVLGGMGFLWILPTIQVARFYCKPSLSSNYQG